MVKRALRHSAMEIILAVLCAALALTAPNFLSTENALNILRSVAFIGVIAFGMTMVIVCGEIDLSVGSAVALAGCLTAFLVKHGWPTPAAMAVALAAGYAAGAFIGWARVGFQVPSFITSLALLTGLKGLAFLLTGGFPIAPFPRWFGFVGGGYLLGVPFPAVVFVVVFAAVHFIMKHTAFGREIYAVGGNAEAARLSGIRVGRVRIAVLGITGWLAALSGIMLASRITSGTPTVAQGWELDVIAAVIIGGTSLQGGMGTVRGTLVGVMFIGVIINGMTLLDVPIYSQYVVRGALILAAVLVNKVRQGRA